MRSYIPVIGQGPLGHATPTEKGGTPLTPQGPWRFHLGHRASAFPSEPPLQALSPEGSKPGVGGPSQRQIHTPSPYPALHTKYSGVREGRLTRFLQKRNVQTHSRRKPSAQTMQQLPRVE